MLFFRNKSYPLILLIACLLLFNSAQLFAAKIELEKPDPIATQAIGSTSFDPKDRLAIVNLLSSYGYLFDEGKLDEYRNLFSESARFEDLVPNKKSASLEEFMTFLIPRAEYFNKNDIQRRHFLGPMRFATQTESTAAGQVYLQLYSIEQGGPPSLLLTGYYSFKVEKIDQQWKISSWQVTVDSRIEAGN